MAKSNKRSQAAIVSLLDALQNEGVYPITENTILEQTNKETERPNTEESKKLSDSPLIPYQIEYVDPKQCDVWHMANRLGNYLTEESCEDLIESIEKTEQKIPAIARKTTSGSIEIVCGARRRFACQILNKMLMVAIVDLSDKEALLVMDAENRPRQDISPYERALDYKKWVDSGLYRNYAEIIAETGMKKSWFSKLIALTEIDSVIIQAFKHLQNMKQKWGYTLVRLSKKSDESKKKLQEQAKFLINKNLPPEKIFSFLKQACSTPEEEENNANNIGDWFTNQKGEKIFCIRKLRDGTQQIILEKSLNDTLVKKFIDEIKKAIIESEC